MKKEGLAKHNILEPLKAFTPARIALGRAGTGIPLKAFQAFKLAHAHARDAVYSELDIDGLNEKLSVFDLPVIHLHSAAAYREQYLQRPDLGRKLNEESAEEIKKYYSPCDVAIVIADGLSAMAVNNQVVKLVKSLLALLQDANFQTAPLTLVKQGRVAIADEIGLALGARLSLIIIGERPGLSSGYSAGVYITYQPKPGLTDECRNCVSNIHAQGLSGKIAAEKIFYLIQEAFKYKQTGITLKDNQLLLP
ncbi:ethanolamine ammonia-lyase subunit EutC [Mucilaginibacter auburnensis]|uniref:Ethanolamine ammonia-lyase small subunit n=1 Tax=Mucilaginibacter auburnensis TaxID=1457233 RepID=A0A2H9VME9_9SPHI|nr:ethanolamine ammonia-lyase subunit EutC [Mucilaginibacter auburnensis]PJJ79502.1 ethanolamine ammonia-lyase small subunit [Mucilaginibacter auburnensis]